jgi:PAS domain S-box-containing protein
MNYNNKTKDELIKKLRELHLEFDSLKTSFEKDIIERKQAEKVIRKLSMRQEAILETVPEIIMEVDENKIYTWANRSGLEFFGKDVIGKEASFYFEGEQETYSLVQSLFDGSKDFFYLESWQRRCDGKKRLLGWWCQVLIDEQDKVTGALSSARDITENKQAEEMMKASEEKYRMIFNEVPIGIAISTIEGNIIEVNKAQAEMIGYTVEELKGKSVNEYYVYPDIRMEMIRSLLN